MNRIFTDNKLLIFSLFSFSLFFIVSCGSKTVPKDMNDEQLYEAAVEKLHGPSGGFPWVFRGRDYDQIFLLLKEVQLRYTYSPYATLAELRTADAYFEKGEYETAALEYEEFIKLHPGHKEVPYATYRLALSYYEEISSPDRDPTATEKSLKWFNAFVDENPGSPLVPDAEQRIQKCRDRLAKRQILIGNFYNKRKNYKAAVNRYATVVDDYPDTNKFQEALYLLGRAYADSGDYELARGTLSTLIDNYPDNKYSGKASSLLSDIEGKTAPDPNEIEVRDDLDKQKEAEAMKEMLGPDGTEEVVEDVQEEEVVEEAPQ